MSLQFEQVATQALALDPNERLLLAEQLWASVPTDENDEELFAEIERREREIESGVVEPLSHDEVMDALHKAIKQ